MLRRPHACNPSCWHAGSTNRPDTAALHRVKSKKTLPLPSMCCVGVSGDGGGGFAAGDDVAAGAAVVDAAKWE